MCGIWGYLSKSTISSELLIDLFKSSNTVRPRGPERSNVIYSSNSVLNFHRLAINGLSSVQDQPYKYSAEDGTYYVMCNGEIYNCYRLIDNYSLQSEFPNGLNSDTEVIFPLFKTLEYNFEELNKQLLGEYALVILKFDKSNNLSKCWISTDPVSVRPVFIYSTPEQLIFSSLLIGLTTIPNIDSSKIYRLKGGEYMEINALTSKIVNSYLSPIIRCTDDIGTIQEKIVKFLCEATKDRLLSDRPIGCLLSGGVDSSLTSAIVASYLRNEGKKLHTFSIGLENSPDCKYAKLVAEHIGSIHTEIIITEEEALSVIPEVIKVTESYDITTIRASVWQYLLAKYISEHTDIKVVIAGEGSDELLGYVYCKLAPSNEELQKETEKLIKNIHLFDGIRADRCISHFGLEARFPFLDERYVNYILSIPSEWKIHTKSRMEKMILRQSFDTVLPTLLPRSVLMRSKVSLSDGCSEQKKSWFEIVQDYISRLPSTEKELLTDVKHCLPVSEESRYYRKMWQSYFGENASHVIPYFWLPNKEWYALKYGVEVTDPAQRLLPCYHNENE